MHKEKKEKIIEQIGEQTDYHIILQEVNILRLENAIKETKDKKEIAQLNVEIDAIKKQLKNAKETRKAVEQYKKTL